MTHYTPLPLWQPVLFKLTCAVPPAPARCLHRSRHRPRRELRPLPAAGLSAVSVVVRCGHGIRAATTLPLPTPRMAAGVPQSNPSKPIPGYVAL
jgi:hypothetical protein